MQLLRLRLTTAAALVACGTLPAAFAQTSPTPPDTAASAPPRPAARPADAKSGEQLRRVEISGTASDESIRKASTASKIVITREEIEKFGDSTVGEVLKRLPGVTTGGRPGRGGDVRMRGMGGGYTQILVNGERMPPGFSLDQLPPEQVERIEVLRAPTAEYGTRAMAGTINVVLREALKKKLNEFRAGVQVEHGKPGAGISWSRNDGFGDGHAYNLSVNAQRGERVDDITNDTVTRTLATGDESGKPGLFEGTAPGVSTFNAPNTWTVVADATTTAAADIAAGRVHVVVRVHFLDGTWGQVTLEAPAPVP